MTKKSPTVVAEGSPRHGRGFWLIAFALLVALAFSTVPTPLYPLYQRADGFSALIVTIVFAVYAVGVVTSLLLAGHLSDHVGRRRVLLAGLVLEFAAAVLFLTWTTLSGLLLARFLSGLGVGLFVATATAYLLELHRAHRPDADGTRFEIVSTAANLGGLGTGTLVAGALAQFVTAPLRTPYVVFLILLALSVGAVVAAPETVAARGRFRPQRVRIAGANRLLVAIAALAAFAAFAVFGLFASLAPSFVAGTLHHSSRLLAGFTVFVVFGAAAGAQVVSGRRPPRVQFLTGLLAQAAGLIIVAAGMLVVSLPLFLTGGAIAGAGAGILLKWAIGTVAASAPPQQRGESLAGLFFIGYLGLVVPVLGLGVATRYLASTTSTLGFSIILLALLGGIAVADRWDTNESLP